MSGLAGCQNDSLWAEAKQRRPDRSCAPPAPHLEQGARAQRAMLSDLSSRFKPAGGSTRFRVEVGLQKTCWGCKGFRGSGFLGKIEAFRELVLAFEVC